jgi:hypothetical protein
MMTRAMISTHPAVHTAVNDALIRAIKECLACAQACVSCADACLAEPHVGDLRQCIRLDLDCADICFAGGRILTRRTGSNPAVIAAVLEACVTACGLCAAECERHDHEHCRLCADACRRCETACGLAQRSVSGGA